MSKIYDTYIELKKETENNFYLFKVGMFHIFVDEDAKFISEKLNLKLTNLNDSVMKCGFPTSALNKYINELEKLNIPYKIVDSNQLAISNIDDYIKKTNALDIISKISEIDINNITPVDAINILKKLKERL